MSNQPSAFSVTRSIVRALLTVRAPAPSGAADFSYEAFGEALSLIEPNAYDLARARSLLDDFLTKATAIEPDELSRESALAFWVNLYNAEALRLACAAELSGLDSLLRVPGAYVGRRLSVSGEDLSLDDIEHGKLRRFGDPRIHGAVVCGAISCPALRAVPFTGDRLSSQLDDQMKVFLDRGGAVIERDRGAIRLSRTLLWYGADFVRPSSMPTILPSRRRAILESVSPWLSDQARHWVDQSSPRVEFQPYDWGLRCAVSV